MGILAAAACMVLVFNYYGKDLPDHQQLKDYQPPIVTRIYAGDGRLMAEFAKEKRVFVPISSVPDMVKNAFLAAEDQNFYKHRGIDPEALGRAGYVYAQHMMGKNVDVVGGSTITQQVVKNFLLTNERTFTRKIKEAILAYRMEEALSKDRILELYLNEIYLGGGAYGVAAASLHYFNKSLKELDVAEAAYLAALPKAPNNYNPIKHFDAATARRNWVIGRMLDDGHITAEEAAAATAKKLEVIKRAEDNMVRAPYFAEEVRRELAREYQEDGLYKGGLVVRSSLDPHLQKIAMKALRDGLVAYDRRHGYRGPIATLKTLTDWQAGINAIAKPEGMIAEWQLGAVLEVNDKEARIGLASGLEGKILLEDAKWARKYLNEGYAQGPEITALTQVLEQAQVITVSLKKDSKDHYVLEQIPHVQGGLIALDPHTGRVLAMQGGWEYGYGKSEFNRATQAKRQPGSAFKPFVYLAALDNGFTPATLVLDSPFQMVDRPGNVWRPQNYSDDFLGPTTVRVGVEKSRNLMTVRLANYIGMDTISAYAGKFGITKDMPPMLSFSLGASETTLLDMTMAYAMLVNGGKQIKPTFVDRIQDRTGKTIFKHDARNCFNCGDRIRWQDQDVPAIPDTRGQIQDPRTAYQMVSILEGVVERGTATKLKDLGYPLAGKTGTTNESKDTWFIGFSPDLVVGVFAGFDEPRSLGKRETGASIAVPIFKDFMAEALKDTPPVPFRVPEGIRNVLINAETGVPARSGDTKTIWEAFVIGTEPSATNGQFILDNQTRPQPTPEIPGDAGLNGTTGEMQPITGSEGQYAGEQDIFAPNPAFDPLTPAQPAQPMPQQPGAPVNGPAAPMPYDSSMPVMPPPSTGAEDTGTGGLY